MTASDDGLKARQSKALLIAQRSLFVNDKLCGVAVIDKQIFLCIGVVIRQKGIFCLMARNYNRGDEKT